MDFQTICRLCIRNNDKMKELFTLSLSEEGIHATDFIKTMTGLKLSNADSLPKNICTECISQLTIAFKFAQLCIKSDKSLRNEETRRILRKIEEEALKEDEEVSVKEEEAYEACIPDDCSDSLSDSDIIPKDKLKVGALTLTDPMTIKDKYKCKVCSSSFNNKTKFLQHEKTHDQSKPFKCEHCLQTFSKKFSLNVHMRCHVKKEDKKYACKKCGEQFIFQYLLKQHEYKHSDQKPFPCPKCNKGCLTEQSLKRHMITHDENYTKKTHTCKTCSKEFPYPSFLAEHMKNHTGEKPYLCSTCGKGFRQSGALHYHQRTHTGYKPFTCKICNDNFMSQSILKVHMRKHTNERPYVCDICGMCFRQSTDLKSHTRTHTGDKPVLCTICGKKMSTTGQLTVHIRSHTGEKPFACNVCSRAFTTKTMLVKHQRIHTGERPYACDVCGKAFNQSSTLRMHANTHKNNKKRNKPIRSRVVRIVNMKDTVGKLKVDEIIADSDKKNCENQNVKTEFTVILPAPMQVVQ